MTVGDRHRLSRSGRQAGSALILVLFACLATAVVLQSLYTVLVCAERAVVDESVGRKRLGQKDEALALLRQQALNLWQPGEWRNLSAGEGSEESAGETLGEGAISELADSGGWVMGAAVRQDPTVSRLTTSAWLERGRDGVDLPLAALVAEAVTATAGRGIPWVEIDEGGQPDGSETGPEGGDSGPAGGAVVHIVRQAAEPLLGAGCAMAVLAPPWRLDAGWANVKSLVAAAEGTTPSGETPAVALGPGVRWFHGRFGGTETLPSDCGGLTPETPVLILLTGGAALDARNREDIYGVIVVDDGSVLLDGTVVHGAIFVTGAVSLGDTGRLRYSRPILRWATDRSLNRVRLIPGTRAEGME